jgi:hypothetical protein
MDTTPKESNCNFTTMNIKLKAQSPNHCA